MPSFPPCTAAISFKTDVVYVVERGKNYKLTVYRVGRLEKELTVNVRTEELTAVEGIHCMWLCL